MAKQIDLSEPGRNMFGLLPCPKCRSVYRYTSWDLRGMGVRRCDDCKHEEPLAPHPLRSRRGE